MRKNPGSLGLIDEDNRAQILGNNNPAFLNNMKGNSDKHNVQLLIASNDSKVICLKPRLEEWILFVAKRNKIDLRQFKIPVSGIKFHNVVNTNLDKLEKILHALAETPQMQYLQGLFTANHKEE